MKTFLAVICIDDCDEEVLIEANNPEEAISKMFMTYGFDSETIIICGEIDEEYAEMLGYDTY
jgi:hypothetical protein